MKNLPEIKKKGVLRSWFWPEKMQGFNVMLMPVYFQVPQGMAQAQVPSFAVTEAASEPGSSSSPELSSVPESAPAEEVAERSPEHDRLVAACENAGVWGQYGEGLWLRATRLKLLDER